MIQVEIPGMGVQKFDSWETYHAFVGSKDNATPQASVLTAATSNPIAAVARNLTNTAAYGQGPKIAAGAQALLEKTGIVSPPEGSSGRSLGEAYSQTKEEYTNNLRNDQANFPIASGIGSVAGSIVSPLGKALKAVPYAGSVLSGVESGAQGALNNPDATTGDIVRGGAAGGVFSGATQVAGKAAQKISDFFGDVKLGQRGVGNAANSLGFSTTLKTLDEKAAKNLQEVGAERAKLFESHTGKLVDMPGGKNPMYSGDIKELGQTFADAKDLDTGSALMDIAMKARTRGEKLTLEEAELVKEKLGKLAYNEKSLKRSTEAGVYEHWRDGMLKGQKETLGANDGLKLAQLNSKMKGDIVLGNRYDKFLNAAPRFSGIGPLIIEHSLGSPAAFTGLNQIGRGIQSGPLQRAISDAVGYYTSSGTKGGQ